MNGFEPNPKTVYRCPECGEESSGWTATDYIWCEDCGSHSGMVCPKCEWGVDLIYNDLEDLEVKE